MSVAKGRKLPGVAAFAEKLTGLALPGLREVAQHAAVFLFGLLYARGIVFSRCAPFGTAAVAACPYRYLPAAVIGALAGYVSSPNADFQPMNANYGILRPLGEDVRDKAKKRRMFAERAIACAEALAAAAGARE